MKKVELQYDNHIENMDQLIEQLESLKKEAFINISVDPIFQKDFHALMIIINYLKENKGL